MQRILLTFLILLGLAGIAHAADSGDGRTITIAADQWCPINCDPDDEKPGLAVEIAKRIFEPKGYTVNYIIVPWARALSEANTGDVDAVIGATHAEAPNLVFPNTALALMSDDFYVVSDSKLTFSGIESLKDQRLGIIHGYGYGSQIEKLIAGMRGTPGMVQEINGDNALEQNLKKLLAGRIDVLVDSGIVVDYKVKDLDMVGKVRRIGGIAQDQVYMAFSPTLPEGKTLAGLFDDGIDQLKTTHELDALYAKYGVTP